MTIDEFNRLDRRIDQLFVAAAGEPFLEHTLRPLHTIFRRIGWIYHSWVRPDDGLGRTLALPSRDPRSRRRPAGSRRPSPRPTG